MAGELQVIVEPWGPSQDALNAAAQQAVNGTAVRSALGGAKAQIIGLQPLDLGGEPEPPNRVRATLYDYAAERALLVEAPLEADAAPIVRSSVRQPLPSSEERDAAISVLREDPDLGPELVAGRLLPYRAMPPLAGTERPDGVVERTITVGLRPVSGNAGHEIVGVHLGRREVVRFD